MDEYDFDYIYDELIDDGLTPEEASEFIRHMIIDNYPKE